MSDIQNTSETAGYDETLWNAVNIDNSPFIKIEVDTPKIIRFLENDPHEVGENQFGQETWEFDVLDSMGVQKVFTVSSMLLKRALFGAQPLSEVDVVVTRTGEEYETAYTVERIEE